VRCPQPLPTFLLLLLLLLLPPHALVVGPYPTLTPPPDAMWVMTGVAAEMGLLGCW
jgi:hypothetical protein